MIETLKSKMQELAHKHLKSFKEDLNYDIEAVTELAGEKFYWSIRPTGTRIAFVDTGSIYKDKYIEKLKSEGAKAESEDLEKTYPVASFRYDLENQPNLRTYFFDGEKLKQLRKEKQQKAPEVIKASLLRELQNRLAR